MERNLRGNRKLIGFVITVVAILLLIIVGLFHGVVMTGDNMTTVAWMLSFLSGAYFGANFGEHWAKTKASKEPVQ